MRALVLSSLLVTISTLTATAQADRLLSITNLENCKEFVDEIVVKLETIEYHTDPATGARDTVHGDFSVKSGVHGDRVLTMTLYKCPDPSSNEPCFSNPTVHQETLGCERLTKDDSGPWAMFSSAIAGANCGKDAGVFSLDYSTLKLNNIINYLDIHDDEFGRFRMRMYFHSAETNSIRACSDLDFKLLIQG